MAGELEAGAEAFERLQHGQAPLRGVVELAVGRDGEERIGAGLGPADAAADLVELGEAEIVGAMHHQRVGVRNVEAGFDDGGGEQHIEFPVIETGHDIFQFGGCQAAMGGAKFYLGHVLA